MNQPTMSNSTVNSRVGLIINLIDAAFAQAKAAKIQRPEDFNGQTFLWRLKGLLPCKLCRHSVPIDEGTSAEKFTGHHLCGVHRTICSDLRIEIGCRAAERLPGTEGETWLSLTFTEGELWVDTHADSEVGDLREARALLCGDLSLALGAL